MTTIERKQLDELTQFLTELHDDLEFEIFTAAEAKDNRQLKLIPTTVSSLDTDELFRLNAEKCGIWFTPNSMEDGKRKKENVTRFNALPLDLDFKGEPEVIANAKAAKLPMLLGLPHPPTAIIETRNGYHAHWFLEKDTITELHVFDSLQKAMQVKLEADSNSLGAEHLFRVPGYNHWKVTDDPFMCSIVHKNYDALYTLETLGAEYGSEKTNEKISPKKDTSSDTIPHNIERMELRCGYIRDAIETAYEDNHLEHEPRVSLGAVYKHLGVKGEKRIHEILSECTDYNKDKTNIKLSELTGKPTTCEKMCGRNKCDAVKATDYESPIGFAFQVEAQEIYEKRGRYVVKRFTKDGRANDRILTEWLIRPIKIVNLGDKDVLYCDIVSTQGNTYFDQRLENEAWHGKQKLLKALGHSDLTFHGTDADVQNLAQYITSRTLIKKTGINYIGLKDEIFVAKGVNISKDGISYDPEIELYIKGTESFAGKYDLTKTCSDQEYLDVAKVIYDNLPIINEPGTIYPLIGWTSLAPIKQKIVEEIGAYPNNDTSGEAGSGKTATLECFRLLSGAIDSTVHDCRITKFALLHLVSSTNGIPIILDEFKESTMDHRDVNNIKAVLRSVYRGGFTERGHADQSVSSYKMQAPVILSGESSVDEVAVRERAIYATFKKKSLNKKEYVDAFKRLNTVDLGLFQPRYIQYLLGVDLAKYFTEAGTYFSKHETFNALNPRIQNNWLVLHVGLSVWYDYGVSLGLHPKPIPFNTVFKRQAEELGYNTQGHMLRDVDKLIEHMSLMAEKGIINHGYEYAIEGDIVQIHTKLMLAALRKYSQSHNLDIFIMDERSYKSQLKDADYFLIFDRMGDKHNRKRCANLDFKKMEAAGLEVEGFSKSAIRFIR